MPNIRGLSGKIVIGFTVDKDGEIKNPKILKSVGYGTDEEAINVVTTYKNFVPGEIRGIKIKCTYSLPITYKYFTNAIGNQILMKTILLSK